MSEAATGGGRTGLKIVLIVAGICVLLLAAICAASAVISAVTVSGRRMRARQAQVGCANHLKQIGALYITDAMERPDEPPPYGGPALLVHYAQSGRIRGSAVAVLLCPSDPEAASPDDPGLASRVAGADLTNLPRDVCSYAVYDFPAHRADLDTVDETTPLAACPHHGDGVNVLFFDGSVRFWDWIDLDLPHGASVEFGPDSDIAEFMALRGP